MVITRPAALLAVLVLLVAGAGTAAGASPATGTAASPAIATAANPATSTAASPGADLGWAAPADRAGLSWRACHGDLRCADLLVPADWSRPGRDRIPVGLLKIPARADRLGTLLLNPGGPGAAIRNFALPAYREQFAGLAQRPAPADLDRLTPREREVLLLVARGLGNAEIARALTLGEGTVKTHVARVLAKLGLRTRVHAAIYAHEHGLVR